MRKASLPLASGPPPRRTARRRKPLRPVEEDEILTLREGQVLACFAQGLGTAAIAQRLSISPTTVRNHSQRILAKLRAHSRLEAVARGYSSGLLPVSAAASDLKPKAK